MRIFLSIFSILLCCYANAQVVVYNTEPGLLEKNFNQDSSLLLNKALHIKGVLAKEDIHFVAAIAKKHNIKQLDLSKSSFREIGFGLFEGCDSLQLIKLPPTLKTIAKNAFKNCGMLSEIEFSKQLTSIGSDAFYNCGALRKVTINKNLSWIGKNAFYGCPITSLKIKGNKYFLVKDNHLYDKKGNKLF